MPRRMVFCDGTEDKKDYSSIAILDGAIVTKDTHQNFYVVIWIFVLRAYGILVPLLTKIV